MCFGKATDTFQVFPGSVSWNAVKGFCSAPPVWDVRWMCRVVCPPPSASTHTLWFSLKHSYLPRLAAATFIYSPLPLSPPDPVLCLCSLQCEVLMSRFLMPSSPESVCHLDLFFSVALIFPSLSFLPYFTFCSLGVRCFFFYKPGGVSLCDLQFEVRWYHLKVQINYSWTSLTLCGLLTENAAQSFTPVWHQPWIFSLYLSR